MKYKTIIFDMDGTIIDTEGVWKKAVRKLILRRGIHLSMKKELELGKKIRGLATHKSCKIIKEDFLLKDPLEKLIEEKNQLALESYKNGIRFISGFLEFHAKLEDLKIEKGVATNANKITVEIVNQALNLKKLFGNHIYDVEDVNFICKPDPALFLYAADKLKSNPTECVVIEDSAHGIEAAKKAGMLTIGINSGGNKDFLKEADIIVNGYNQINLDEILS